MMFTKFGEMNSYKEINELAENLFNEGDIKSLKEMAKENGIPEDMTEMYLQGEIPQLCEAMDAEMGKIDIEARELKPQEIMLDWVEYLRGQCMENEMLAFQVRKKGKSLAGCIGTLLQWSYTTRATVHKDVAKAAGIGGSYKLGVCQGMATAKKLITEYYMGK